MLLHGARHTSLRGLSGVLRGCAGGRKDNELCVLWVLLPLSRRITLRNVTLCGQMSDRRRSGDRYQTGVAARQSTGDRCIPE